jgi:hypothetical protein
MKIIHNNDIPHIFVVYWSTNEFAGHEKGACGSRWGIIF